MGPVIMTFYDCDDNLVRVTSIESESFVEQFDWDGWYGYHCPVFVKINEERAVDLALSALQVRHPGYQNRGKARFKLYEFDLSQLHQFQVA